jgi:hypothetical protein
MHHFRRAGDGVDWTGLNTQSAAYTQGFIDKCNGGWARFAEFAIDWLVFDTEQRGQLGGTVVATGRALIDVRLSRSQRVGIRAAAGIAAHSTLRLRQQGIDPRNQTIAIFGVTCR